MDDIKEAISGNPTVACSIRILKGKCCCESSNYSYWEYGFFRNGRMCMKYKRYWGHHNYLVFIGDQRTRQLFYAFLRHITAEEIPESKYSYFLPQEDTADAAKKLGYSFVDKELNLTMVWPNSHSRFEDSLTCPFQEFIWDPFLRRALDNELNRFATLAPFARPIVIIGSLAVSALFLHSALRRASMCFRSRWSDRVLKTVLETILVSKRRLENVPIDLAFLFQHSIS